jgi:hypothetical protein
MNQYGSSTIYAEVTSKDIPLKAVVVQLIKQLFESHPQRGPKQMEE